QAGQAGAVRRSCRRRPRLLRGRAEAEPADRPAKEVEDRDQAEGLAPTFGGTHPATNFPPGTNIRAAGALFGWRPSRLTPGLFAPFPFARSPMPTSTRSRLGLQCLEIRQTPTNNVTAQLAGPDLLIQGDDAANGLSVVRLPSGRFRLEGGVDA